MEAVPPDSIFRKQSLIRGLRLSIVFVYPLIGMSFLTIWHVRAQLSLAGDKLRLAMVNLYISHGSGQRVPLVAHEWVPTNRTVASATFRLQMALTFQRLVTLRWEVHFVQHWHSQITLRWRDVHSLVRHGENGACPPTWSGLIHPLLNRRTA